MKETLWTYLDNPIYDEDDTNAVYNGWQKTSTKELLVCLTNMFENQGIQHDLACDSFLTEDGCFILLEDSGTTQVLKFLLLEEQV